MRTRRDFLRGAAGAAAGVLILGSRGAAQPPRRQVTIGGRRVRVIDIHAHCVIPVQDITRGTPLERQGGGTGNQIIGPMRIEQLDRAGIDVQVLSINGYWWYAADRELAMRIVRAQNEGLARIVATYPERFVALASVALQFPDLAAQQLEDAVKRLNLRGASIGGHVNGEDLSLPKYDPFWAKAAELGLPVFMHPGGADNIVKENAFDGRGDLGNIIGNPLETTYFLSRLIFDGTLDRFPGLRIIGAHGAGYLPSYLARTDVACRVRSNANCANKRSPRDYFRRELLADSMVFTDEGLRHLVAEIGVSQVVFGTDMPFNWPSTLDTILQASYLSDADKEAILGGTLAKLLRL
ncbi:MAG TPA: amidohydrolase family protein [Vicinamibacterales bacterium]|nr:amidohydrolase family protein [Vicinamibacterales bacterium]